MPSRIFLPDLLQGQVVVVTGGGSGLGRATAQELSGLGATVVIAGRRAEPLEETASLCEGFCEPVVCDIREEDQVNEFVDAVVARHGRVDTLVNNAGGQYMTPAEDISLKGFETVVRLNLIGTWLMSHAVATKSMIPGDGGKILSVTLSPHHGLPGMAHSSAARAAVENLMRVLSIEWARFNIKTTAEASGHFRTDALKKYPQPVQDSVARTVPLQRLGEAEEQAWLVAYLASPAGGYYSRAVLKNAGAHSSPGGSKPTAAARKTGSGRGPPLGMRADGGKPLAEERKPK